MEIKGYYNGNGYMGWMTNLGKYIQFESYDAYLEVVSEIVNEGR